MPLPRNRRSTQGGGLLLIGLPALALLALGVAAAAGGVHGSRVSGGPVATGVGNGSIAFVGTDIGSGDQPSFVYVMAATGAGQHRLTRESGHAWSPDWSPDGKKIAFVLDRISGSALFGIAVANANGSGRVAVGPGLWGGEGNPAFSPDGKRIAFDAEGRGGEEQIFVMSTSGTGVRRLTDLPGGVLGAQNPDWSPDGKEIVFNHDTVSNGPEIDVIQANGTGLRRLTKNNVETRPKWSPDGKKIAFARSGDIWVMNADGSVQRKLLSDGSDPAWSPDGKKIVFDRTWHGSVQVYVMNADGSGPHRLTSDPTTDDTSPSWQPLLRRR